MKVTIIVLFLACTPFIAALTAPQSDSFSRPRHVFAGAVQQRSNPVEGRSDGSPVAVGGGLEKRRGGGGGGRAEVLVRVGNRVDRDPRVESLLATCSSSSSGLKGYGGGRYYGGGASVPYKSGQRSPLGITPFILPIVALGIFPGLWLWSVYAYPYPQPFHFMNHTITNATFPDGVNQTLPVLCLCQQFAECGCDGNTDQQYVDEVIGNGSLTALNTTLARVSNVNETLTLVLNGTLPNGTEEESSGAAGRATGGSFGWWVLGAAVSWAVWMM